MKETKCHLLERVKKIAPVAGLLFLTTLVHAQDREVMDSLQKIITDTAIVDMADDDDEEEDDEMTASVFVPRSEGNSLDSIAFRQATDSFVAQLRGDEDFWYANTVFRKEVEQKGRNKSRRFIDSTAFETILWLCVIGGFVAVLIIYLSNNNASLFRSSRAIKNTDTDGDPEMDDIFSINYEKELDKAITTGNYRLGVRLLFLQLLRRLSEKNIIRYKHDSTNFDYLLQVNHAPWYSLFFRLTRNYEYAWYGHFEIDQLQFNIIRKDFTDLNKQLPAA